MSVAAAAVLMSTGAQAFETNDNGDILALTSATTVVEGQYTVANVATEVLSRSFDSTTEDRQTGDALIFPAFKSDADGKWETEVVFRNNYADRGVVAKVVIYDGKDSKEIRDFNVYLSANDQVRFTINQDNKIHSTDGSIAILEPRDANKHLVDDTSDLSGVKFASKDAPFNVDVSDQAADNVNPLRVNEGYIVVYGLFETNLAGYAGAVTNTKDYRFFADGAIVTDNAFHLKHKELWHLYREVMDTYRVGDSDANGVADWRQDINFMRSGVYTDAAIPAPNQADTLATDGVQPVGQNALSGTVRIYSTDTETRDVILPATALANFSDAASLMLWAPREYAAIGDRCIDVDNDADGAVEYNEACVVADTNTFLVTDATYTFENDPSNAVATTVANTLLITQPTKRFLTQLMPRIANPYWNYTANDNCNDPSDQPAPNTFPVVTGEGYGIVADFSNIHDDDERIFGDPDAPPGDRVLLVSPGNLVATPTEQITAACNELSSLSDIERGHTDPFTNDRWPETSNGFIKFDFISGGGVLPAIVTQMKATRVNGQAKINWIYTPSNR